MLTLPLLITSLFNFNIFFCENIASLLLCCFAVAVPLLLSLYSTNAGTNSPATAWNSSEITASDLYV